MVCGYRSSVVLVFRGSCEGVCVSDIYLVPLCADADTRLRIEIYLRSCCQDWSFAHAFFGEDCSSSSSSLPQLVQQYYAQCAVCMLQTSAVVGQLNDEQGTALRNLCML